jgi:uncharacterized protein
MRYNVAQLLKGPTGAIREYDLTADIGSFDPELEPVRPLTGSITLMRTSQGILVTGELETTLRGTCRRCLERCDVQVEVTLEEEFYPATGIGDAPMDAVAEEDRDEALLIDDRHILDLGEVVRQELWLALPTEALCQMDCAGLCPQCGGNRNLGDCRCIEAPVDPRWAMLQTLLSE